MWKCLEIHTLSCRPMLRLSSYFQLVTLCHDSISLGYMGALEVAHILRAADWGSGGKHEWVGYTDNGKKICVWCMNCTGSRLSISHLIVDHEGLIRSESDQQVEVKCLLLHLIRSLRSCAD